MMDTMVSSDTERIVCPVCPHRCSLGEGAFGICRVRTVEKGKIISVNYGEATALSLDPIEKKPLARFHPGSSVLSYGSFGCNLRCRFCQNSDIAMVGAGDFVPTHKISPEDLVEKAIAAVPQGNIGIAYTYNEPFIGYEFLIDTASLAHESDLLNVVVTNGYVTAQAWDAALPLIDAFNIDLKCYTEEGYRTVGAPGGLAVVKRSIESAHEAQVHVEVTTLVVPGLSDDERLFDEECTWLASVDPDIPLHISRFFPHYKETQKEPTDRRLLDSFEQIARRHLTHVFLGNIW